MKEFGDGSDWALFQKFDTVLIERQIKGNFYFLFAVVYRWVL
jgi:hypothetical protein